MFLTVFKKKVFEKREKNMNFSMINNVYLYRFRLKQIKLIFVTCYWGLLCMSKEFIFLHDPHNQWGHLDR